MILLADSRRDKEARQFIGEAIGVVPNEARSTVLTFTRDDDIVGVFLFEKYTGRGGSVTAHWAASQRGWLTPDILRMVFIYAYDELGVNVILGEVETSDEYVRGVDEKLGFVEVAKVPGYFPHDDLVIYSLTKQDCRWLPDAFKEDSDGRKIKST